MSTSTSILTSTSISNSVLWRKVAAAERHMCCWICDCLFFLQMNCFLWDCWLIVVISTMHLYGICLVDHDCWIAHLPSWLPTRLSLPSGMTTPLLLFSRRSVLNIYWIFEPSLLSLLTIHRSKHFASALMNHAAVFTFNLFEMDVSALLKHSAFTFDLFEMYILTSLEASPLVSYVTICLHTANNLYSLNITQQHLFLSSSLHLRCIHCSPYWCCAAKII